MSETTYKWSRFNHIVTKDKERVLVYNTYSLYYRWIYNEDFEFLTTHDDLAFESIDDILIKEGYVVESDIDEIERLRSIQIEQTNNEFMFIVIYTTMACNYRCSYCLEGDRLCNEYLDTEKSDEIISFIKRYMEKNKLNSIYIKWFGGEPLLNFAPIEHITSKLEEFGYTVKAKMYTNGRLLTKNVAEKLKQLHVDDVIVQLDGLEKTYTRLKKCSKEDYYAVIQNIKDCEDIINISVAINITSSNKNEIIKLVKKLRNKYGIKSFIGPNRVMCKDDTLNIDEYYELWKWFNKNNEKPINRKRIGCEAQLRHYIVLNTKGDIFKCENIVNIDKYKIGNISDVDINELTKNENEWNINHAIDECKDCKLLPICMNHCHTNNNIFNYECRYELLCKMIYDRTTK